MTLPPAAMTPEPKTCEPSRNSVATLPLRPSLSAILAEAELVYGDDKPEFCINEPKDKVRTVKDVATGELKDLWYRKWRSEGYGY